MHEMALAQSLVEIIEEQAARDAFTKVRKVWMVLGALAHVDAAALRFGFDVVARGTVADGAELVFETRPARAYCLECSREVVVTERAAPCPECQGHQWVMIDGEEMKIRELEVE
ncbi:hydrogenase maturation nickel metallochaperone HypA [Myxococcota bacterium]|nr:hydrogenase maturation nickel metallochaperone HypA [Myxococcota bacterium]